MSMTPQPKGLRRVREGEVKFDAAGKMLPPEWNAILRETPSGVVKIGRTKRTATGEWIPVPVDETQDLGKPFPKHSEAMAWLDEVWRNAHSEDVPGAAASPVVEAPTVTESASVTVIAEPASPAAPRVRKTRSDKGTPRGPRTPKAASKPAEAAPGEPAAVQAEPVPTADVQPPATPVFVPASTSVVPAVPAPESAPPAVPFTSPSTQVPVVSDDWLGTPATPAPGSVPVFEDPFAGFEDERFPIP